MTVQISHSVKIPIVSQSDISTVNTDLPDNLAITQLSPTYHIAFVNTSVGPNLGKIHDSKDRVLTYPISDYFQDLDTAYDSVKTFENPVVCLVGSSDVEPTFLTRDLYEDVIFISGNRTGNSENISIAGVNKTRSETQTIIIKSSLVITFRNCELYYNLFASPIESVRAEVPFLLERSIVVGSSFFRPIDIIKRVDGYVSGINRTILIDTLFLIGDVNDFERNSDILFVDNFINISKDLTGEGDCVDGVRRYSLYTHILGIITGGGTRGDFVRHMVWATTWFGSTETGTSAQAPIVITSGQILEQTKLYRNNREIRNEFIITTLELPRRCRRRSSFNKNTLNKLNNNKFEPAGAINVFRDSELIILIDDELIIPTPSLINNKIVFPKSNTRIKKRTNKNRNIPSVDIPDPSYIFCAEMAREELATNNLMFALMENTTIDFSSTSVTDVPFIKLTDTEFVEGINIVSSGVEVPLVMSDIPNASVQNTYSFSGNDDSNTTNSPGNRLGYEKITKSTALTQKSHEIVYINALNDDIEVILPTTGLNLNGKKFTLKRIDTRSNTVIVRAENGKCIDTYKYLKLTSKSINNKCGCSKRNLGKALVVQFVEGIYYII
uniref:Uncharacterized protein n=1 Tax=Pithovirus LCPAC101 TaxID=2506586 RepID=A0A481Z2S7_9VIRU|nr:MAG: hypothetical protein LCPAC101_03570 [Pithovirus LCPAC101]